MGKISEVYYEELTPDEYDAEEAAHFYFYYNLLGVHDMFTKGYEEHELKYAEIRNKIIKRAMDSGRIPRHPKMSTAIFGKSIERNRSILAIEY